MKAALKPFNDNIQGTSGNIQAKSWRRHLEWNQEHWQVRSLPQEYNRSQNQWENVALQEPGRLWATVDTSQSYSQTPVPGISMHGFETFLPPNKQRNHVKTQINSLFAAWRTFTHIGLFKT